MTKLKHLYLASAISMVALLGLLVFGASKQAYAETSASSCYIKDALWRLEQHDTQ